MIILNDKIIKEIVEHCKKEMPNEACGILAGKGCTVEKVYFMENVDKSPYSFFMDPKEQIRVMKEIRSLNMEMVGIYHSHVESRAYPSSRDVELAFYPDISYLIVSLRDLDNPEIKSFKIKDGKIFEEEIKIE